MLGLNLSTRPNHSLVFPERAGLHRHTPLNNIAFYPSFRFFAGIMRPIFQKDEWKLVALGAVLGLGIGLFQLYYVWGGSLTS